ncbi:MAG TPA: methyltransferase domain-containing protein [Aquella sp.]|nr:methyltransferase domain-containing protein [Aquella sp.]
MGLRVELGSGPSKPEGFIGVDIVDLPGVTDVVHDLEQFPWPFEDNSVEEIICCHVFEHIEGKLRGKFMDEVWRILEMGGKATFTTPAWNSERSIQDFSHAFPAITGNSYAYFVRDWREQNKLTFGVYDLKCNFEVDVKAMISDNYSELNRGKEEMHSFAKHHLNTFSDIVATLIKIP